MKIYIDADACPRIVKEIVSKAAVRTERELVLVANQPLVIEKHPLIRQVVVSAGFDKADDWIAEQATQDDVVITADIPLADRAVTKGAIAINPRGYLYTKANIKQRLSMRNFMESLRSSGVNTGGPKPLSEQDVREFSNILDRYLTKMR